MIEYASHQVYPEEKNYCTAEKEASAVIWAVGKSHGHLEGRKFQPYTTKVLTPVIEQCSVPSQNKWDELYL